MLKLGDLIMFQGICYGIKSGDIGVVISSSNINPYKILAQGEIKTIWFAVDGWRYLGDCSKENKT